MRDVDGRTRVCGLIGNPVEHTLSPLIHNTLAEYTEKNLIYVPFSVEADRLEAAVRGAYALHILGLNVTVPYKSAVIPYLEEVDELAKQIGAVNTLVRCEMGLFSPCKVVSRKALSLHNQPNKHLYFWGDFDLPNDVQERRADSAIKL